MQIYGAFHRSPLENIFCAAPPFPSLLSCFPTLSYIAATIFYTSSALHALSPSDASVSPEKN